MKKGLVIGCGYIGLPLVLHLREQNWEMTGWVHSEETAETLRARYHLPILVGNVGEEAAWQGLDTTFDLIVHCASSGRGGEAAYHQVFWEGWRQIIRFQAQVPMVFVSSTSVYAQNDGLEVTEESEASPTSPTGKVLRETEEMARQAGAIIARSAGIYGPGRAVLVEKLRQGEAVMEGDGLRWMNQIQQMDLVAALDHLIQHGRRGEIYNVCDDTPSTYLDYYKWCSHFFAKPMPPFGAINLQRKRGVTNKRVSNAKLKAMGWTPLYPSFREGLATYSPK